MYYSERRSVKCQTIAQKSEAIAFTGCGESDVMVLTPYGDAVIRNEGSSSGSTQTPVKETVKESAAESAADMIGSRAY